MSRPSWAYCPECGGHVKEVRYDVLRREAVYRCDAYRPCGWRSDGETEPVEQQAGLFDGDAA